MLLYILYHIESINYLSLLIYILHNIESMLCSVCLIDRSRLTHPVCLSVCLSSEARGGEEEARREGWEEVMRAEKTRLCRVHSIFCCFLPLHTFSLINTVNYIKYYYYFYCPPVAAVLLLLLFLARRPLRGQRGRRSR